MKMTPDPLMPAKLWCIRLPEGDLAFDTVRRSAREAWDAIIKDERDYSDTTESRAAIKKRMTAEGNVAVRVALSEWRVFVAAIRRSK